ncbi:hypothetical protein ACVBEJ_06590 [Porticoccus sp. GXU_MW_L64]
MSTESQASEKNRTLIGCYGLAAGVAAGIVIGSITGNVVPAMLVGMLIGGGLGVFIAPMLPSSLVKHLDN